MEKRHYRRAFQKVVFICQFTAENGQVEANYQCAGCGEWIQTSVDESAGSKQSYVEDCQVCCKPNVLYVSWDQSAGEFVIRAELE